MSYDCKCCIFKNIKTRLCRRIILSIRVSELFNNNNIVIMCCNNNIKTNTYLLSLRTCIEYTKGTADFVMDIY